MTTPFPTTQSEVDAATSTVSNGRGLRLLCRGKSRRWQFVHHLHNNKVPVRLGSAHPDRKGGLTLEAAIAEAEKLYAEVDARRQSVRQLAAAKSFADDVRKAHGLGLVTGKDDPNVASLALRNLADWLAPAEKADMEANAARRPVPTKAGERRLAEFVEAALANRSRKNATDRDRMRACLERYAGPLLEMPVAAIEPVHVADTLAPLMEAGKRGAAKNLRQSLSIVLRRAAALRAITVSPMADGSVLNELLPNVAECSKVEHRPAVEMKAAAPAAYAALRPWKRGTRGNPDSADAVRLVALTACRSKEVGKAVAGEFDLAARIWTIPGERMKKGKTHAIPLSAQAVELVRTRVEGAPADAAVFPELAGLADPTQPMRRAMRRVCSKSTVHGWRATFADWADWKNHPDERVLPALAHGLGSSAAKAYTRVREAERRRDMLQAWADHLTGET